MNRPVLAASILALLLPGISLAQPNPGACKLVRIAEWPVRLERNLPLIEGAINGRKIGVLLDTGAYASIVTKDAAERLGLTTRDTAEFMYGVGGASRIQLARIRELRVGGATRENLRVRVGGERPIPGVEFILGDDFFKEVDIEFDYARRTIRLFRPVDCKDTPLAYWDRQALQVPMEDENKIVLPVKVNGKAARALLDSGASSSMVSLPFAETVGVSPGRSDVLPSGCTWGIGADRVRQWVARFDRIQIAEETMSDSRLNVANVLPELSYGLNSHPEVILGTDFLRSHRVYVARSQRKVYFSYIGGLVFPTVPRLDCGDEDLQGKDAAELRAAYDRAIAENPANADARIRRAALAWRERGAKAALEDLDAAVAAEPTNAVALGMRADVRSATQDYPGALADTEAAIANGMRTAEIFVVRANLRRAQGDVARAMAEYDQALELDPRSVAALRSRGRFHYHAGRYEASELDFASVLAIRPSPFDSIWLALARMRRGLDANAALEEGMSRMGQAEWPMPVMRHMQGRLDMQALMAAAANPDPKLRREHECEARYYASALLSLKGKAAEARPLVEQAAAECPRNFVEYDSARIDLKE
jgi:predicted aspartyl protease/tetratricopeptide (TPR) repeat protein